MTRTLRLPKPLEKTVQRDALQWLAANSIPAWRRNIIAVPAEYNGRKRFIRSGEPGQSDLWGLLRIYHGLVVHFEAECKRPGEYPTLDQVLWLRRINELTGAAFWFDRIEILERVIRHLRSGGRVEYLPGTRRYGKATGPTGDYDLVGG